MFSAKSIVLWALIFSFMGSFIACSRRSVPIVNYDNVPIVVRSNKTPSLEDINKAVAVAATIKHWTLSNATPGHATASLVVRDKHTVVVDIVYTEKALSMRYKDSTNMHYQNRDGDEYIHRKYNKWTSAFLDAINKEILEIK